MFKSYLVIGALLLATTSAFANDSAFPKISVKGIDPGPMTPGSKILVYGGDAADLLAMLPAIKSVDPEADKSLARSHRELTIISRGLMLQISCDNANFDPRTGASTPKVNGTECAIELNRRADSEIGDSYQFKPKDAVTNSCQ